MSDEDLSRILAALEAVRSDIARCRSDIAQSRSHTATAQLPGKAEPSRDGANQLRDTWDSELARSRSDMINAFAELRAEMMRGFALLRGELAQTRTEMTTRMDRMQDAITALRDDVNVNYQRANRAEDVAQKGIDGMQSVYRHLSEEVAGMHRQIRRLQADVRMLRGEPS